MKTAIFIEKAKAVHGDKFGYSKVEYKDSHAKVVITCKVHGDFEQAPTKHLSGQGCAACSGAKKKTFATVMAMAREVHGDTYDYIESTYKNMLTKMTIVCKEHGEFKQEPTNHIYKKTGCPKCASRARGVAQRLSNELFVEKAVSVHGNTYDYSKVQYQSNGAKVEIVCPDHGVFMQAPSRHITGQGCPKCAVYYRNESKRKSTDQFIAAAKDVHGDKYDYSKFQYLGAHDAGTIICSKHGEFQQDPSNHLAGKGCPICVNQVSKWEMEVTEFVQSLGFDPKRCRKTLNGSEVDILVPEKNVGIECHGLWFHSTRYNTDSARHLRKHQAAEKAGIRLIQLFEDEWTFNRSAAQNLIKSALGATERLYARKCEIVRTTSQAVADFLNEHHVQGSAKGGVVYSLQHEGSVVAVMVFSSITSERGAVNAGWELVRYASAGTVVGGASKLFKAFLAEYNPSRVISYSDRRLFSGEMYKALGFTKVHDTRPNYTVIERGRRNHKANYKKANLIKRYGAEAVVGKTEREVCEERNLYRVYDCGLTKWEYKVLDTTSPTP